MGLVVRKSEVERHIGGWRRGRRKGIIREVVGCEYNRQERFGRHLQSDFPMLKMCLECEVKAMYICF